MGLRCRCRCVASILFILGLGHAGTTEAFGGVPIGLGLLPSGGPSSVAALSSDGTTVVTSSGGIAYRWRAGAWQGLGNPGADVTVHGVSGDGNVVTGAVPISSGATVFYPRVWRGGSWLNLPLLDSAAIGRGVATAANANGSIVVGPVRRISTQVAAQWTFDGAAYSISNNNGFGQETNAEDVNGAGDVVVGWSVITGTQGDRAYRWGVGGSPAAIDGPGGVLGPSSVEDLRATAINASGTVIVGSYRTDDSGAWQVWRRIGVGATALLGAGEAFDVSIDGIVAAGANIYDAAGTGSGTSLYLATHGADVTGWSGLSCLGVSDDGLTFAGVGVHEISPGVTQGEAWLVTVPSPGAGVFVVGVAVGWVGRRRRTV